MSKEIQESELIKINWIKMKAVLIGVIIALVVLISVYIKLIR